MTAKLTLALLLCAPLNAAAEIFAADGYLQELKKVETAKAKKAMEPLYLKAQELCDELSDSSANLKEEDYRTLGARFRGIELGTAEVPGAWIRPGFFYSLALKKGRRADVDFFRILKDEDHAGNWSVYVTSHTDFIGCDTVGSGAFAKFYGRWSAFHKKYPGSYSDAAEEAMQKIEDVLKQTGCICGGRDAAVAELKAFLEAFPETMAAEDLQERMKLMKRGGSGIVFECKPS